MEISIFLSSRCYFQNVAQFVSKIFLSTQINNPYARFLFVLFSLAFLRIPS